MLLIYLLGYSTKYAPVDGRGPERVRRVDPEGSQSEGKGYTPGTNTVGQQSVLPPETTAEQNLTHSKSVPCKNITKYTIHY